MQKIFRLFDRFDPEQEKIADMLLAKCDVIDRRQLLQAMRELVDQGMPLRLIERLVQNFSYYPVEYFINLIPEYKRRIEQLSIDGCALATSMTSDSGRSSAWLTKLLDLEYLDMADMLHIEWVESEGHDQRRVRYMQNAKDKLAEMGLTRLIAVEDHSFTGAQIDHNFDILTQFVDCYVIVANATDYAVSSCAKEGIELIVIGDKILTVEDFLTEEEIDELERLEEKELKLGGIGSGTGFIGTFNSVCYVTSYKVPDNLSPTLGYLLRKSFKVQPVY